MSRIFLLEATILTLQLNERVIRDAEEDANFFVKIQLLDLPSLTIPQNGTAENNCCQHNLNYNAGCACHFVATGQKIVKELRKKPLKIGIYRRNESFPRCHALVPFSGCICDLVSKSLENTSSFEFAGTFDLIEPGGNPAGNVAVSTFITDFGRKIISAYALDRETFVLKNKLEGCEYRCGRIRSDDSASEIKGSVTKLTKEKLMRDIAGICLGAVRLSQGKPEAAKGARQSLKDPEVIADKSEVQEGIAGEKKAKNGSAKKRKGR